MEMKRINAVTAAGVALLLISCGGGGSGRHRLNTRGFDSDDGRLREPAGGDSRTGLGSVYQCPGAGGADYRRAAGAGPGNFLWP